jgi:hypothetical protein
MKITLSGIVGYTFAGFLGWAVLRGVFRVVVWALTPTYEHIPPIVFGGWELVGTVSLSAALGALFYAIRKGGITL